MPEATRTIPLFRLVPDEAVDPRSPQGTESEDAAFRELVASVRAGGLKQPLLVRPGPGTCFRVVEGRRRLRALEALCDEGHIGKKELVPVLVQALDDNEAREAALAANIVRLPLHPVDTYEAFATLASEGLAEPVIADHFGVTVQRVRQSLALGRLAPEVRAAWRAETISGEQAQAFAVSSDPIAQAAWLEKALAEGYLGLQPQRIRQELTNRTLRADHRLAVFAGIEAYEAAGGAIIEDLFEDGRYLTDGDLVQRIARDRLAVTVRELADAGWGWSAWNDDLPAEWQRWPRFDKLATPPTEDEKRRLAEIAREVAEIEAAGDPDDTVVSAELDRRYDALGAEQAALETAALVRAYGPEDRARCGCVLSIGWDGELEVIYGVLRPAAVALAAQLAGQTAAGDDATGSVAGVGAASEDGDDDKAPRGLSKALREELSVTLTQAAAATLARTPDVALRVLLAQLEQDYASSPARIAVTGRGYGGKRPSGMRNAYDSTLPGLLGTPTVDVIGRLAPCIARSLDLTDSGRDRSGIREKDVDATLAALPADTLLEELRMAFDAEAFFAAAPKAEAIAALVEMFGRNTCISPKKADIAALAALRAGERGWLPGALRPAGYALIGADETPAAAE